MNDKKGGSNHEIKRNRFLSSSLIHVFEGHTSLWTLGIFFAKNPLTLNNLFERKDNYYEISMPSLQREVFLDTQYL